MKATSEHALETEPERAPHRGGQGRGRTRTRAGAFRPRLDVGRLALGLFGAVVALFLLAPIVTVVASSFTSGNYIVFPPQLPLSLHWYRAFLHDDLYRQALQNSLLVAALTATLAVAIGTAGALGFTKRRIKGQQLLYFLLFLPFFVPGIVLGIGLSQSLAPLGLESLRGSYAVVVTAHLLWAAPLVFVVMVAVLRGLDPDLAAAAMTLGAGPWRTAREVTLPLIRSGVLAGLILAFVISLHEFVMALFLTGPNSTTLPVVVWNSLRFEVRPIIAAIDSVMVGSVVVALLALGRLVGMDKITMR